MIIRSVNKFLDFIKLYGFEATVRSLFQKLLKKRARCFEELKSEIVDKDIIEIGGPSRFFSSKGVFPIYQLSEKIDNLNYSCETVWNSSIAADKRTVYEGNRAYRKLFLNDSSEVTEISDESYDILINCHVIEHIANPIKTLQSWRRFLKYGGLLVTVLPHKDATFDHLREATSLQHIIDDYNKDIGEDDLSHKNEILALHDARYDKGFVSQEDFRSKIDDNLQSRIMHHHTFTTKCVADLIDYLQFEILFIEPLLPCHILIIAKKVRDYNKIDNSPFLSIDSCIYKNSPFSSDHCNE